jgi:hypothetical protein
MPHGIQNPDTIKPDMSDYPYPGKSDPEAHKAWRREYHRRYYILNVERLKAQKEAYENSPERKAAREAYENGPGRKAAREAYKNSAKREAYQKSAERKASQQAYENSAEGRAVRKAYKNNPEVKARMRAYYNSPEGKAQKRAYENSAEGKAMMKRKNARRRQAKSEIPLTQQERQQLIILEQKRLHLTETTGIEHHLDHIMPLSKGGIHHPINLRIITAHENISKHNKVTPEAMALIPQIQAIVNERKGWLNTEQDSTLADLFTTDEDET